MALLPSRITEALTRGATVLTGNQRAARTLRREFDEHNRRLGLESWEPPSVLAWDGWTAAVWLRLLVDGHATQLLLSRAQEHTVWRDIIAADRPVHGLTGLDSLAEMAADAWSRLCAYRGEKRLRTGGISVDTKAFRRWAFAFEERCRMEGYLTQAQLEGVLTATVADGKTVPAKAGYVLVGFDGWTPAQEALAVAVRGTGVRFEGISLDEAGGTRMLVVAESRREELACAAHWLRQQLEANPATRAALIVPGLDGRRAELDRALRRTLSPELEGITAVGLPPFEFSLGIPMGRTALGAAALDLLRWAIEPLPLERISGLLRSPYIAGGAELRARATFDAYELRRRKMLRPELTLAGMAQLVEGARRMGQLGRLLGALKGMRRVVLAEGFLDATLRPHADWAEAMRALLEAAGWGGAGDSLEFQTRRKWESVLDEMTTLDFTGVRVSARDALATVERLAGETLFAPESRSAPVQVMGPLESAGSVFDAVWFLGAGELEWPVRPRSSPLLSWQLQKELGMPGADAEGDAAYARRMTGRIAGSAGAVVFSYATEAATGGRQGASAVVAGLGLQSVSPHDVAQAEEIQPAIELETIDDSDSLPPVPDRMIRGGAKLLQLQAACGFRAFAEMRLGATSLDGVEAGMDARERGNAVHVALEIFWKQVVSQAELKALTTEERRGILAGAVEIALGRSAGQWESEWEAAYIDVQRERLMGLLDTWLITEMKRPVAFVVRQSETELKDARIGPLRLSLRVDRVDETEFGDVIVDYKTGAASPGDWLTERPDEPQLPLYAVLADSEQLAGVAFGQVRAGKDMTLHGYETQQGVVLKAAKFKEAATLEEQVDAWRVCLTNLAEDFHRGDVRVRPKSYPHTCQFCEQRLLCRLDVSLLEMGAADEAEDAEDDLG